MRVCVCALGSDYAYTGGSAPERETSLMLCGAPRPPRALNGTSKNTNN